MAQIHECGKDPIAEPCVPKSDDDLTCILVGVNTDELFGWIHADDDRETLIEMVCYYELRDPEIMRGHLELYQQYHADHAGEL